MITKPFAIAVALFAVPAGACDRKPVALNPCAAPLSNLVELRARDGSPRLLLRAARAPSADPRALTLCDGEEHLLGTLVHTANPPALAILNVAGDAEATLIKRPGDDPVLVHRGVALRLHEENHLLRILDGQGVPLAQIGSDGEKGVVFDPAGHPILTAERVANDPGRRAVHERDGAVRDLVTGIGDDRAAAAFAVDALPLLDRLLIARFLDEQ